MIVGVGIDVVDIGRFTAALGRTRALSHRLFTERERRLSPHSLAARFAAGTCPSATTPASPAPS